MAAETTTVQEQAAQVHARLRVLSAVASAALDAYMHDTEDEQAAQAYDDASRAERECMDAYCALRDAIAAALPPLTPAEEEDALGHGEAAAAFVIASVETMPLDRQQSAAFVSRMRRHRAGIVSSRRTLAGATRSRSRAPVTTAGRAGRAGPRARACRSRPTAAASARGGDSGDPGSSEGDGEPPPPAVPDAVRRFAHLHGLTTAQIRWCDTCTIPAFAIDAYQRGELDRLGFLTRCPDCCSERGPPPRPAVW